MSLASPPEIWGQVHGRFQEIYAADNVAGNRIAELFRAAVLADKKNERYHHEIMLEAIEAVCPIRDGLADAADEYEEYLRDAEVMEGLD